MRPGGEHLRDEQTDLRSRASGGRRARSQAWLVETSILSAGPRSRVGGVCVVRRGVLRVAVDTDRER